MYTTVCSEALLKQALNGKSVGFISYGQSGAGKTYTMFGDLIAESLLNPSKGLASRAVLDLLKILAADGSNLELHASIFQVYVDQIKDLAILFINEQKKQSILIMIRLNNSYYLHRKERRQ